MKTVIKNYNLKRFLLAQKDRYEDVKKELKAGKKETHWMWYFFPQIEALGFSETSRFYSLKYGLDEAKEYYENRILKARLNKLCNILLKLATNDPVKVFEEVDALKLKSSMTLFHFATKEEIFSRVLEKFFNGEKCSKTIALLNKYYDTDFFFEKECNVIFAYRARGCFPCCSESLLLLAEVKYHVTDKLVKTKYHFVGSDWGYDLNKLLKDINSYDLENFPYSTHLNKEQFETVQNIISRHEENIRRINDYMIMREVGLHTMYYFKGKSNSYFLEGTEVEEVNAKLLEEMKEMGVDSQYYNNMRNALRVNELMKEIMDYIESLKLEEN